MYDLVVVGAGPAGSAAARRAAQRGLKTLLIEKEKLPRPKLCGGGLTPKVLKLLDFKLPTELILFNANSVRIHVGDHCSSFETDQPLVHMTSRAIFDSYLTGKALEAGAELKSPCLVRGVKVLNSQVEVVTSEGQISCHIVIGADGVSGSVATLLHPRWEPGQVSYAIESEIPVSEHVFREVVGNSNYFDLFFGVSPAGYGWIFPKHNHLTVGVGCRLSNLRDGHGLFEAFVKHIPELTGTRIPRPRAHLIPLGGAAQVPYVGPRILLAGDAAGFAEPLLGEGIYFAIQSGQIAAEVTVEACNQERFDEVQLADYRKRCEATFGVDFDVAQKVARFSYLEQYNMKRVTRFFFADKKVQECMLGLMEGSIRYRDAQLKLVWPFLKYRLNRLGLPFYS